MAAFSIHGRMTSMTQFSLKDIFRGLTLASVGFGMLAIAFHSARRPISIETTLWQPFLVAFGGMLVGYGFAFLVKYPPHQMMLAAVGMFTAEAWQFGSNVGLLVYLGLTALLAANQFRKLKK